MNGQYTRATFDNHRLYLNLKSGESRILICSDSDDFYPDNIAEERYPKCSSGIDITDGKWKLSFVEEHPRVRETFSLKGLQTWETLSDSAAVTMGTGVYETVVKLSSALASRQWYIDLGDVRESARVFVNGKYIGCAWAAPYILDCKNTLRQGRNTIRIEVTNLPANRIADLDRRGVAWRKMKDINVVDINYKRTTYENWESVKSGLCGRVVLRD